MHVKTTMMMPRINAGPDMSKRAADDRVICVLPGEGADDVSAVVLLREFDVGTADGAAEGIAVTEGLDKTCAMLEANASWIGVVGCR